MESIFESTVRSRINKRVPLDFIHDHISKEYYVAGNCLNRSSPNDIDVFPTSGSFNVEDYGGLKIICKTKNAITTKITTGGEKYIVQFCNYNHPSLESLVDSFDFSHVQIGAHIVDKCVGSVYYTDAYVSSKLSETSEYTGSEYPLASLMRSFKYHKRGDFAGKSYLFVALSILNDIMKRGVDSYDDFKDQLDAVDLGLLPEELSDFDNSVLKDLYNNLVKEGR